MKVYINKYRSHWLSPYTILEKVLFWKDWDKIEYDTPWVEKWSDRLQPFCVTLQKILDKIHPKIDYVKIDPWDTWSMDHTLAKMVLPMLKQLKETKHGSPYVDLEDVPEHLRSTTTEDHDDQLCFDFYHENQDEKSEAWDLLHKRWDWVMDEMIFAFEHKLDDSWEDEFRTGEIDHLWVKLDETHYNPITQKDEGLYQMKEGPNHTYEFDYEGYEKVAKRIENGFRLFGKYYSGLWD